MRLAGLRPKKGDSGKGVAARYRAADNTMAVSFEDPRKRVKEPAIQKVGGAQRLHIMLRSANAQHWSQVQHAGSFTRCSWRTPSIYMCLAVARCKASTARMAATCASRGLCGYARLGRTAGGKRNCSRQRVTAQHILQVSLTVTLTAADCPLF